MAPEIIDLTEPEIDIEPPVSHVRRRSDSFVEEISVRETPPELRRPMRHPNTRPPGSRIDGHDDNDDNDDDFEVVEVAPSPIPEPIVTHQRSNPGYTQIRMRRAAMPTLNPHQQDAERPHAPRTEWFAEAPWNRRPGRPVVQHMPTLTSEQRQQLPRRTPTTDHPHVAQNTSRSGRRDHVDAWRGGYPSRGTPSAMLFPETVVDMIVRGRLDSLQDDPDYDPTMEDPFYSDFDAGYGNRSRAVYEEAMANWRAQHERVIRQFERGDRSASLLEMAINRSFEDTTRHKTPQVQDLVKTKPPEGTRDGYTRSLQDKPEVVCCRCSTELGVGDETLATDDARQQARRVYFRSCGHVYCGTCIYKIKTDKKRGAKTCDIADCKASTRNITFTQIYY